MKIIKLLLLIPLTIIDAIYDISMGLTIITGNMKRKITNILEKDDE